MFGRIFNIQRFAVHDGPGIRTLVFLHGCPLSCLWCHNPESQGTWSAETQGFGHRMISLDDLLVEIEKDRLFFDESQGGVTFSGGEPLSQSAFLSRALTLCRDRRIHSAVDTCGVGGLDALDTLALADLILFDIKGLGAESLLRETGARLSVVMETLEGLVARGRRIWLRLPFVPGYGLMKEGADSLGKWLEPRKDWFERVCLLPFHHTAQRKYEKLGRLDGMQGIDSPSDAMIAPFLERLKESHPDVRIGG